MVNSNASSSGMDPETLAAFLDGTLKGKERDEVVRALARSPELYQTLIEAAEIRSEIPATEDQKQPIPIEPRARAKAKKPIPMYRRWTVLAPAAAAALVGILVVSQIVIQGTGPESLSMLRSADWYKQAKKKRSDQGLDASWRTVEWPGARGGGANDTSVAAAVRAGVLLVNLEFAATVNQPSDVAQAAKQLQDVLAAVPDGGYAATLAGNASDVAERRGLDDTIRKLFHDSPWYNLGIWLGQARLSALAGDASFVAPGAPGTQALKAIRDQLAADPLTRRDANSQAALNRIDTLLKQINQGGFNSPAALNESLHEILTSAAARRD